MDKVMQIQQISLYISVGFDAGGRRVVLQRQTEWELEKAVQHAREHLNYVISDPIAIEAEARN